MIRTDVKEINLSKRREVSSWTSCNRRRGKRVLSFWRDPRYVITRLFSCAAPTLPLVSFSPFTPMRALRPLTEGDLRLSCAPYASIHVQRGWLDLTRFSPPPSSSSPSPQFVGAWLIGVSREINWDVTRITVVLDTSMLVGGWEPG